MQPVPRASGRGLQPAEIRSNKEAHAFVEVPRVPRNQAKALVDSQSSLKGSVKLSAVRATQLCGTVGALFGESQTAKLPTELKRCRPFNQRVDAFHCRRSHSVLSESMYS